MSRFASTMTVLVLNVLVTLILVKAYRDRAGFQRLATKLDDFFAARSGQSGGKPTGLLFLVSFGALYVEVMMIRWIGTEIRVFAYFQNLALITCFLGFGLGCYWAKSRKSILLSLIAMTALVALVQLQASFRPCKGLVDKITTLLSLSSDAALWGGHFAGSSMDRLETWLLWGWSSVLVVVCLLLLLVAVMIPLGQWVGSCLDRAPNPINAYSENLLGSIAGVWIFAGLAFFWMPPIAWFLLAFAVLLLIGARSKRLVVFGLLLVGVSSALFALRTADSVKTYWSPYQKLDLFDTGEREYEIRVNNTGYMSIANLTAGFELRHPEMAQGYPDHSSYDVPFRFPRSCDDVLIVGAGAGNDAAAALRNGAGEVTTVEIDPVIYFLGEKLHPERPYSSPRVHMIRNDARAFLRHASQKYDVVLFGLLDSHTEFSDFSNMRIDNYVYTEEAFREARRTLKPEGVLIVKFEVRAPWTWMGQRLYRMLEEVFGRPPIVLYVPPLGTLFSASVFVTSDDAGLWSRASEPALAKLRANPPSFPLSLVGAPDPTTDDWPYFYHRGHWIPRAYLVVSLILLAMTVVLVRGSLAPRQATTWTFFLLGAGFLLLETQLVSRLALYFGTTWLVNCVALSAVLLVLVGANFYVASFHPDRLAPYYILLVVSLLANYFTPWEHLPYGAPTVGLMLSAAYCVSVFFAGVIFTETFAREKQRSNAFGANIVGAVAGGLAQNASFVVGMKALLLIATLLYAFASVCGYFSQPAPSSSSLDS